jgi:glycosyltransferase involved in cell wall biosynthesis
MKKISVIIPVKNRASLLSHTLDNILNQTLKPYEIIVVDDGSEDNLQEVIDTYKDRVIFLKNKGRGPGAARNEGFGISKGEYIQFFDSDDLMTKNKLEVQANKLAASNSGMIYCPHFKASLAKDNQWQQESPILYYKSLPNSLRYDQWLLRGACMITQACLFDKNIFKESGLWRTDLMPHDDLEFLFRIGKVVPYPTHTNKVAVLYRQHGQQITDLAVSNQGKTFDQLYAWNLIQENMDKQYYNWSDFMVIQENILHCYKHIHHKDKAEIGNKFNFTNRIFNIYNKVNKKYNRLKSRSEWQSIHGISKSKEIFRSYIEAIPE